MSKRTHFIYRAFDANDRLLYVGCTRAPEQRRRNHRTASLWFAYATRFTMSGPYAELEALRREGIAIETELPWFNATSADRGGVVRWKAAHNREWVEREPNFVLWSQGIGWDHDAMNRLNAECNAAVEDCYGPCPDIDARHAAYLKAVELGATVRSAA